MAVDFKVETTGDIQMELECPVCGWSGEVYYKKKPPTYCSNACKQKASRIRKKRLNEFSAFSPELAEQFDPRKMLYGQRTAMQSHIYELWERERQNIIWSETDAKRVTHMKMKSLFDLMLQIFS